MSAMKGMLAGLFLMTTAAAQSPPAVPPRDPVRTTSGSGAVSGRVLDKASGQPLPRAVVTLVAAGSQRWRESTADRQGRYEFTGLEATEYSLWASPGEFRGTHSRQAFGESAPMESGVGMPGVNLVLKEAEVRSDLDIALARAFAIEGRVIDPHEEPMAEVEVVIVRSDGRPYPAGRGHSDDRGEFRLFGLAPGRYRVCAVPPNGSAVSPSERTRLVRTCHLASTSLSGAADIAVGAEDVAGIDIRVQRSGTVAVSGSVHDAAGQPVEGAWVSAVREDREVSANTRTRLGEFVLPGLTPGRYLVQASVGGPENPSDKRPPAREQERGFTILDIGAGDVGGLVVPLSKARRIQGRVRFEGGAPRAPSRMRMVVQTVLEDPWSIFAGRPPFAAVSDRLDFELNGVYRQPLSVFMHGLPEGWVLKAVRYDGRDITGVPIELDSTDSRQPLDIVLTNRVALPRVRVTDEQGEPVTTYRVAVIPADPARWKGPVPYMSGIPSRDGMLKLDPILPGDYLVAALTWDDHGVVMRERTRIADLTSVALRVSFTAGENSVVQLPLAKLPPRQ